jgi:DNA mismatch repair protein MutH
MSGGPKTVHALMERCQSLEGITLAQLASMAQLPIVDRALARKGWVGRALELVLGAQAGSLPCPDFMDLGIELKTLPIRAHGKPAESTFVTSVNLLTIHQETWLTSTCRKKLSQVLWIPVEAEATIPFLTRRLGRAILWTPTPTQERLLQQDWELMTQKITMGQWQDLTAHLGEVLQLRPKAAHGRVCVQAYDGEGQLFKTLPRGFYLRPSFTNDIFNNTQTELS